MWITNSDGSGLTLIFKSDEYQLSYGQIAWSPDGKSVAVGLETGTVYLIDADCPNKPNGCDESSRTVIDSIPTHWLSNFYPQWAGEDVIR